MVLWNKDERGTNTYLPVFDLLIALRGHEAGQWLCGGNFRIFIEKVRQLFKEKSTTFETKGQNF